MRTHGQVLRRKLDFICLLEAFCLHNGEWASGGVGQEAERTEKLLEKSRQEAISRTGEVAVGMERRGQIFWERDFLEVEIMISWIEKWEKLEQREKKKIPSWMDGGSVCWYLSTSSSLLGGTNALFLFKLYVACDTTDVSNLCNYFLRLPDTTVSKLLLCFSNSSPSYCS